MKDDDDMKDGDYMDVDVDLNDEEDMVEVEDDLRVFIGEMIKVWWMKMNDTNF